MNYLTAERSFREYPVLSVKDITKRFPEFDSRRLVEWQQKEYIVKIRRGFYCFTDRQKDEHFLYYTANKIYAPSYVTLESALAFYNLIPEGVFMTTSVTTRNTARYRTPVGYFEYSHIKPSLFFGYRLVQTNDLTYKIASPEKAILDFFYARKHATESSIEEIRFNEWAIKDLIDFDLLEKFLLIFDSKILYKRIGIFKSVINA